MAAFHQFDPELDACSIADMRDAARRIRTKPAVVVVGVDTSNDPALKTIETISKLPEDIGILVVSKAPSKTCWSPACGPAATSSWSSPSP